MSKKGTKSKPSGSAQSYQSNDIVLAKLRGYPPWPGMVVDENDIPPQVSRERPMAKKGSGSVYCVRFFPAGDHSWFSPKEISLLQKHEIEAYINEPHKKNGDLLQGYKVALDPTSWLEEIKTVEANAASYDPDGEVDELEDEDGAEGEDGSSKKAKGTKRKRDSDVKPKNRKSNVGTEKPKRTKKAAKSAEAVESEDEAKPSSPKKAKKVVNDSPEIKQAREWRHALQRSFLGKQRPKDEDMPAHDRLFTDVENHVDMTLDQLTETKIGKVMRHIAAAEDGKIPRDEEFKFRERAAALVERWQKVAQSAQPNGAAANGEAPSGEHDLSAPGDVTMASMDDANDVTESASTVVMPTLGGTVNGHHEEQMSIDAVV